MRKKVLSVLGAIALMLGLGMNLQYSLNDYGMSTNSLSTFALAQAKAISSFGISSGGGWFWKLFETTTECSYTGNSGASATISIIVPGGSISISPGGSEQITYKGVMWACRKGGWNLICSDECNPPSDK